MVAALSRNDGLLNLGHELLAIHKAQSKTPEISQITGTDDLQHVDAPVHSLNPGFHQTQNPPHPHSPAADMTSRSYPAQHNSPNFAAVPAALAGLYRAAKVGLVTSLRDGMNLVAKEYVAAQDPEDPGVLVLSQFAGASHELEQALIVNPYDVRAIGEAVDQALHMPLAERRERWCNMMDVLRRNDITHWRERFVTALQLAT
jgi:glycosyltransferase involved in cell wall biosynthesis